MILYCSEILVYNWILILNVHETIQDQLPLKSQKAPQDLPSDSGTNGGQHRPVFILANYIE